MAKRRTELSKLKLAELKHKLEDMPAKPEHVLKKLKSLRRKDDVVKEIVHLECDVKQHHNLADCLRGSGNTC